ncbi:HNH endonuclease signature motif containing protein [Enterococcus sp. AZ102]|uniref:HNH endonuclease signature motif containing protein n=1 Tax=Enterococcus sp. AZ102 TaxID=2774865 RepID=UPI003F1FB3B4
MPVKRYSKEQIDFIRDFAKDHTLDEVTQAFNEKYQMNVTKRTMKSVFGNYKIRIGIKDKSGIRSLFSKEQVAFIKENYVGISNLELTEKINAEFGTNFTLRQIKGFKGNRNLNSGLTGHFPKGHVPIYKGTKGMVNVGGNSGSFKKGQRSLNVVPVGTKSFRSDNYWWVKVSDEPTKWRQVHRVKWEKEYGPLKSDEVLIFLDGDTNNLDLNNLKAIKRTEHVRMNQNNYRFSDPELTKTGLVLTRTKMKINEKRKKPSSGATDKGK